VIYKRCLLEVLVGADGCHLKNKSASKGLMTLEVLVHFITVIHTRYVSLVSYRCPWQHNYVIESVD